MRLRRAKAMLKAIRSDQDDNHLISYFCLCLRAHELDTLKEAHRAN